MNNAINIIYRTKFCSLVAKIQIVNLRVDFKINYFSLMKIVTSRKMDQNLKVNVKVILLRHMVNDVNETYILHALFIYLAFYISAKIIAIRLTEMPTYNFQ